MGTTLYTRLVYTWAFSSHSSTREFLRITPGHTLNPYRDLSRQSDRCSFPFGEPPNSTISNCKTTTHCLLSFEISKNQRRVSALSPTGTSYQSPGRILPLEGCSKLPLTGHPSFLFGESNCSRYGTKESLSAEELFSSQSSSLSKMSGLDATGEASG
jgi:hypothetical protein